MAKTYLSLGSNLGDREKNLEDARRSIRTAFPEVRFSCVYETEPVEFIDQPWFLNQVAEVQTDLSPESLLEWASSLEDKLGRQRTIPKGPRTLDVDILVYDERVMKDDHLTLPHPRLSQRRHVLIPLADLNPGLILPGASFNVADMLMNTEDRSQVKEYASA